MGARSRLRLLVGSGSATAATLGWWGSAPPAAADLPGAGIVEGIVDRTGGWAFDRVAEGLTGWVLEAAGSFVAGIAGFLGDTTGPQVTATWFTGADSPLSSIRSIAAVLLVGFVLLAVCQGLVRGDGGAAFGRLVVTVPGSVLATVAVTTVTAKLLELTDALSAAVLDPTGPQAQSFFTAFSSTTATAGAGFAAVAVGVLAVVAGLMIWVELLVRSALVYLLVAMSPLCFAAMVWPAARGVGRRLVELLVAVVVSKLAISVALAVGIAALHGDASDGGLGGEVGRLLTGTVILCLAAFSPFVVLRLLPVAEGALVAQGISRAPVRTAVSGWYVGSSVYRLAAGPATAAGGGAVGTGVLAARAAGDGFALGHAHADRPTTPTGGKR